MESHDIAKALEVWTLQNLLDFSIILGLVAFGLTIIQGYYRRVQELISLRLSAEIWRVTTMVLTDGLLAVTVLIGYMVMNTDIMADIKIAIPFCPVATLFFAVALVLRLFHGAHEVGGTAYWRAVYCMLVANVLNIVGFTFVMEAPSGEYLDLHPSGFWEFVKSYLRSNAAPHGLELAQVTFYVCFALLAVIFVWAVWSAFRQVQETNRK